MPFLVSISTWFAAVIANFFAQFVGKKLVVFSVSLGLFTVLLGGFLYSMAQLINSLVQSAAIPPALTNAIALFIPNNFTFIIGLLYAAKATRFAFDVATMKLTLLNSAN